MWHFLVLNKVRTVTNRAGRVRIAPPAGKKSLWNLLCVHGGGLLDLPMTRVTGDDSEVAQLGPTWRVHVHRPDVLHRPPHAHRYTQWQPVFLLWGQSNETFYVNFFASFEPVWATDTWVKILSILVKNSPSYSTLGNGIITRRVKKNLILELFSKLKM